MRHFSRRAELAVQMQLPFSDINKEGTMREKGNCEQKREKSVFKKGKQQL
jgi:hypothetical protein